MVHYLLFFSSMRVHLHRCFFVQDPQHSWGFVRSPSVLVQKSLGFGRTPKTSSACRTFWIHTKKKLRSGFHWFSSLFKHLPKDSQRVGECFKIFLTSTSCIFWNSFSWSFRFELFLSLKKNVNQKLINFYRKT